MRHNSPLLFFNILVDLSLHIVYKIYMIILTKNVVSVIFVVFLFSCIFVPSKQYQCVRVLHRLISTMHMLLLGSDVLNDTVNIEVNIAVLNNLGE